MMNVDGILAEARHLGACKQSQKATDWKSLVWLLFSPQGREFCLDKGYPSVEAFREIRHEVEPYGVFVEQRVERENADTALIGVSDGQSVLRYRGVDKAYTVVLMHGAQALVYAGDYAVVRVEKGADCRCEVVNDGSAIVTI